MSCVWRPESSIRACGTLYRSTPLWVWSPAVWTSRIVKYAVVSRTAMAVADTDQMSQPEITYGSAGVPVPPVTPFEALNAASPSIRMGSCEVRVGRTEFAGVAAAGGPVAIGRTRPAEVRAAKTKKAETFDGLAASPSTMQKGGRVLYVRVGATDGGPSGTAGGSPIPSRGESNRFIPILNDECAAAHVRARRAWPFGSRCGIEDPRLRHQLVLDGVHGKSEDLKGREPYEVPVAQDHGDPEALPLDLEEGEADRELDRASDDREPGAPLGRDAQAVRDRPVHHGVGRARVNEHPFEFHGAPRAMNAHPCVDFAHVRGHRVPRYERTGYMHVTVGRADAQSRPTPVWQGRRHRIPRSLQSSLESRRQHVCMAGNPYTRSEIRPMTESPASQTV